MNIIKDLIKFTAGSGIGSILTACALHKRHKKCMLTSDRNKLYLDLVSYWLSNKNAGKSMYNYLLENNIKNIAVYGMGTMGELFYSEIENTDVTVEFFIDKAAGLQAVGPENIPVFKPDELANKKPDAIVVTPICYFDSIAADIKSCCDIKVISLEELIYNMK